MANDLAQIVAEKMQVLPIEEQQKVVEFVQTLAKKKKAASDGRELGRENWKISSCARLD